MTPFNCYLLIPLSLLLLGAAPTSTSTPKSAGPLVAEQEWLKLETQMVKKEIQVAQARIEALKNQINHFQAENSTFNQRTLKAIQRYESSENQVDIE